MLFILFLLFAVGIFFYKYASYCETYWERKGVKSPPGIFFFGHMTASLFLREPISDSLENIYSQYKNSNRAVGLYRFLKPSLLLLDAELIKDVMVRNFKDFHKNGFEAVLNEKSDPLLAYNPFFLSGDQWKDKRNEITPAFSPARVKAMYHHIRSTCKSLTVYLEEKINTEQGFDAKDICSRFTTDVVGTCIYSAKTGSFDDEKPELREMACQIIPSGTLATFKFLLMTIFPALYKFFRIGFINKQIEEYFKNLTKQAVDYRQSNNITTQDYLEYVLQVQKKKNYGDLEVAANTITFCMDGIDTSSSMFAFVLYELAADREVQQALRSEINNTITENNDLDYDSLVNLPYLDQVYHEAFRKNMGGFLARECTESIEIEIQKEKKVLIEKGTGIIIPIWSIHHDEEYYEDPFDFKPERFNDGRVKEYKDKSLWLVFGEGPRTCLGQRFAATQIKAGVAEIIKNFEITVNSKTVTPLKPDPKEIFGLPIGGIWLNFKRIVPKTEL